MDRLASMAVFVKAADAGSFSAAASALGMTSQMVGKHVGFLEARLGARLLNRTTRRQSLTGVGREFYHRCRAILAEAEAAEMLVAELSTTPRGRLRVNAPVTFGTFRLAPLINTYLKAYPEMQVELTVTDRYVDMVNEGYDALIRLGPLSDSALVARKLAPYRYVACASPGYLAGRGMPVIPADLAAHECLGFVNWSGVPYVEWSFSKGRQVHSVQVCPRLQVNDQRVLSLAALDGHGVVLAAEVAVTEALATGRLIRVLPDYEAPSVPMHLLLSGGRRQPPSVRTFIDMVVTSFGMA